MRVLAMLVVAAFLMAPVPDGRTVYLAKVEKNAVPSFYSRLAKDSYHVVALAERRPGAIAIKEPVGSRVMLVELTRADYKSLPFEVARLGAVAAVVIPDYQPGFHNHKDHMLYYEAVAMRLTRVAPVRKKGPRPALPLKAPIAFTIDQAFLEEKLRELSGDLPILVDGFETRIRERRSRASKELARKYMRQQFEELGYVYSEHTYRSGVNFVAEKPGDTADYVIVSAHYDTVSTAGADDDGAGVISALAVAEALSAFDFKHTLRIVGFDQEEVGLVGSYEYVKSLSQSGDLDRLRGVINIEMSGYDSDGDGAFHAIDCNENTSARLTAAVMRAVSQAGIALNKVAACTNRSDHASFWRFDKPAIVVSQNFFGGDGNPCYHMRCDQVDLINYDYMSKVTSAIAGAAYSLLEPKE